jgi:hypothetical protein
MSTGALVALTIAVLVAHGVLLGVGPGSLRFVAPQAPKPFVTRRIAPSPPPPLEAPAPSLSQPAPAPNANPPVPAARRPVPPRATGQEAPSATTDAGSGAARRGTAAEISAPVKPPSQALASAPVSHDPGTQAGTFAVPPSTHLHYKVMAQVKGIALTGEGDLLWRNDGHEYEARLEVHAPFVRTRTQTSSGQVTAAGLEPTRFSDKSRSEQAAHFLRDKGTVSFSNNRPDAPLLAGAQDRLSVMLQLGAMIGGAPQKFPPGTGIAVQTADTQEAQAWEFTVEGMEQLQLPGGSVAALKLIRNPRKEFDQKVELWLAPRMDYVPVRLRLTQPNGDSVDQQWSSTDRG